MVSRYRFHDRRYHQSPPLTIGGLGKHLATFTLRYMPDEVLRRCLLSRSQPILPFAAIDQITDEGASALGAVLAGRMGLRSVDLRGNRVSKQVPYKRRVSVHNRPFHTHRWLHLCCTAARGMVASRRERGPVDANSSWRRKVVSGTVQVLSALTSDLIFERLIVVST